MCRNIRTLFNFEPPATDEEVRASALQFVRKLSGFANPLEGERGGVPASRRRSLGCSSPAPGIVGDLAAGARSGCRSREGAREGK